MDAIAAAEERIVSERLRQKLNEVNTAAQTQLAGIQDHVAFTLQVLTISSLPLYLITSKFIIVCLIFVNF